MVKKFSTVSAAKNLSKHISNVMPLMLTGIVTPDSVGLACALSSARAHLDRYIIVETARLKNKKNKKKRVRR